MKYMILLNIFKNKPWFFTGIFCLFISYKLLAAPQSVGNEESIKIKSIDKKYSQSKMVKMKVQKKVVYGQTGLEKSFSGECWISNGKLRLELVDQESKIKNLIVVDGKNIWMENPPPPEAKEAITQVLKSSLSDKKAKRQGLLQILSGEGVLKYFKVAGWEKKDSDWLLYLQPEKQSVEFKRAQALVDPQGEKIKSLKFWDNIDNMEAFDFSDTEFLKKIDTKKFVYKAPAKAEITSY